MSLNGSLHKVGSEVYIYHLYHLHHAEMTALLYLLLNQALFATNYFGPLQLICP